MRTCEVSYGLVRPDLPTEELRFYFNGLKYKQIRVPVQRLCVILPVEEHGGVPFLSRPVLGEVDVDVVNDDDLEAKEKSCEEVMMRTKRVEPEDVEEEPLGLEAQTQKILMMKYRRSTVKKLRSHRSTRSVGMLFCNYKFAIELLGAYEDEDAGQEVHTGWTSCCWCGSAGSCSQWCLSRRRS